MLQLKIIEENKVKIFTNQSQFLVFHQLQMSQPPFITFCPSVFHILKTSCQVSILHMLWLTLLFWNISNLCLSCRKDILFTTGPASVQTECSRGCQQFQSSIRVSGEALHSGPVDRVTPPQVPLLLCFYLWFSLLTPTIHSPNNTCSENF